MTLVDILNLGGALEVLECLAGWIHERTNDYNEYNDLIHYVQEQNIITARDVELLQLHWTQEIEGREITEEDL